MSMLRARCLPVLAAVFAFVASTEARANQCATNAALVRQYSGMGGGCSTSTSGQASWGVVSVRIRCGGRQFTWTYARDFGQWFVMCFATRAVPPSNVKTVFVPPKTRSAPAVDPNATFTAEKRFVPSISAAEVQDRVDAATRISPWLLPR